MRTISADLEQVLSQPDYTTWVKAEVSYDNRSTWVELQDLLGTDWILGLNYETQEANDYDTATLKLRLLVDDMSLSPYMTNSRPNAGGILLQIYNPIRIYVAMLPHGVLPVDSDYYWVFDGRIEETGVSGDGTISARCVSLGAELAQTFIRTAKISYGTPAVPVAVESIMQALLTAWDPSSSMLRVPTSPAFSVIEYLTRREPLFQALKNLALQCGSYVRYQWWSATSEFQHVLVVPDRTKTTSDRTFGFDRILNGFSVRLTGVGVRNRIRVRYRNRNLGGAWDDEIAFSGPSIAKYGERFMELVETETSLIDTPTEALALAQFALDDLREPTARINLPVPYYYAPEIGDLITITADGIHLEADQKLAVVGASHQIEQGGRGTTTLSLEGRPRLAARQWIGVQSQGQTRKEWTVENYDQDSNEAVAVNGNASFLHWSV